MKELVFANTEYVKAVDTGKWLDRMVGGGKWYTVNIATTAAMLDEIVGLRQRVEELERGDAEINAALNEGDGVYRP